MGPPRSPTATSTDRDVSPLQGVQTEGTDDPARAWSRSSLAAPRSSKHDPVLRTPHERETYLHDGTSSHSNIEKILLALVTAAACRRSVGRCGWAGRGHIFAAAGEADTDGSRPGLLRFAVSKGPLCVLERALYPVEDQIWGQGEEGSAGSRRLAGPRGMRWQRRQVCEQPDDLGR